MRQVVVIETLIIIGLIAWYIYKTYYDSDVARAERRLEKRANLYELQEQERQLQNAAARGAAMQPGPPTQSRYMGGF